MTNSEWAPAQDTARDMHRFTPSPDGGSRLLRARCNPEIRTYSHSTTPEKDRTRQPYMQLRTRGEVDDGGFGHLYRWCTTCASEQ